MLYNVITCQTKMSKINVYITQQRKLWTLYNKTKINSRGVKYYISQILEGRSSLGCNFLTRVKIVADAAFIHKNQYRYDKSTTADKESCIYLLHLKQINTHILIFYHLEWAGCEFTGNIWTCTLNWPFCLMWSKKISVWNWDVFNLFPVNTFKTVSSSIPTPSSVPLLIYVFSISSFLSSLCPSHLALPASVSCILICIRCGFCSWTAGFISMRSIIRSICLPQRHEETRVVNDTRPVRWPHTVWWPLTRKYWLPYIF